MKIVLKDCTADLIKVEFDLLYSTNTKTNRKSFSLSQMKLWFVFGSSLCTLFFC